MQDPRLLTLGRCTCWLASYLLSTRYISPQTHSAISTCSRTCRLHGGRGNQGSLSHHFLQDPMLAQCSSTRQRYIYSDVLMWTVCSIVCCLSNKNQLYLAYCIMYIVCIQLCHLCYWLCRVGHCFCSLGPHPLVSICSDCLLTAKWTACCLGNTSGNRCLQKNPYQHFLVFRVLFIKNLDLCCAV